MSALAEIEMIIGPPTAVPLAVDWAAIEKYTSLTFPADFKQWAARYSMLEFDDFLTVGNPAVNKSPQEYVQGWADVLENMRQWASRFGEIHLIDNDGQSRPAPPFPVYPEKGGLFPWGTTTNGDYCCWLTDSDPNKWTIVITTLHKWWQYPDTLTDLMAGMLKGRVHCPIFGLDPISGETVSQFSRQDLGW